LAEGLDTASDLSGPRARSGRPAFHFAFRGAKSFPAGSPPSWMPSTPPLPKVGPTPVAPMSSTAISPRKPSSLPGSWPSWLPDEPEALGLLALMLHAEARRRARRNETGEYVPLAEQDPKLWDAVMIDEAEALLRRSGTLGYIGRYQLEG